MSYDYAITLKISDFKRFLTWGSKIDRPSKEDKNLAKKLEFIIENLQEEEDMMKDDE